ncbi:hypothetical protein EON77_02810 [bacterium]|nr:MAG: hypothetical protein EON77_02810 [bacterium]
MIGFRVGVSGVLIATSVVVGCGGGESEGAKSPVQHSDTVNVTAATPAQIKLGRFVSRDGRHAVVIDRTGAKAKIQIEGTTDVVELTEVENRRRGGDLVGYDYFDPSGKKRLFISTSGSLSFYDKEDELSMSYDKGAAALGRPTIFGAPKKEEARWKVLSEELTGKSIVKKFPELKPEDASDLKKVEAAFAKAEAGSFMRYVERDKNGWLPRLDVAPQNVSGPGFGRQSWKTDETELAKHKKLQAYGAIIQGYSDVGQGNHIVAEANEKSARPSLENGTPGLIWSVDDNSVTFVAFDGGRYLIDIAADFEKGSKLDAALGPATGWPKSVQAPWLDYTDIGRLAKVGGARQAVPDELAKIDDDWNLCAQGIWKAANAKIEIQKFRPEDAKALAVKTQAMCRKHLDRFETTLVTFLDKRKAERAALQEKAKARATQLGLAK